MGDAVLERLEIDHLAKRHIRNAVGRAAAARLPGAGADRQPDLLVLDEPTSGVDMRTAENVLHLLADLNRQGITILITTHDLNAAAAHLPWVICLNRSVIAQGPPEEVFTEENLNRTYHGEMMVIHHDGMILVQQRPHGHTHRDILPNPTPGHTPAAHDQATLIQEERIHAVAA
jgi:zinc/manganese transport system ATP-binding protein